MSDTPGGSRLVVFTRYPTPGRTKTRLIPALGAEGAAELQRRMTEHTLTRVGAHSLAPADGPTALEIELAFDGGSTESMERWVSEMRTAARVSLVPQGEGDLGARMARAFERGFDAGRTAVVIVGVDAPGITADHVRVALEALAKRDVVFGPAADGGYWLVGLARPAPSLFADIDWGTDRVLAESLAIADREGLSVERLPTLRDVDRPEDLEVWEAERREGGASDA